MFLSLNNQTASSPSQEDHDHRESELGLSLRLQTNTSQQEIREEDKEDQSKEMDMARFVTPPQSKLQASHDLGGVTTQVTSPPNRKARVSVRARCQGATVSSTLSLVLHEFFFPKLFKSSFYVLIFFFESAVFMFRHPRNCH